MTRIQQVVFELEMDYIGHPYYVSGNAILHALADGLDYETQRALRVSHGFFAPGQFGKYPDEHSKNGTRPGMGSSLPAVESYSDLFLCRDPSMSWLLDSRARDALNTHDLKRHGRDDRPLLARSTHLGDRTTWYIHAYLHAEEDGVLPLDESTLDGLQFGGARNYGYGTTSLKDTQTVDLSTLDYSAVREADDHLLALVTPYVLDSDQPHADSNPVPWWWDTEYDLRRREESVVEQREQYTVGTVDHGQVVAYGGDTPVKTAKKGIERLGSHAKYGFGELRVIPV
jgi:hypothetical protein